MTEHFTSEEAVALASTIVEDDDYEFNLVNAAINAKQKEWEALGAVAWMSIDSIGERYLSFDKPLDNDAAYPLTHALPAPAGVCSHAQQAIQGRL